MVVWSLAARFSQHGRLHPAHCLICAQVTIYLRDIERDFEGMNGVYDSWLGTDKPTRACVQAKLGHSWLVEIRAQAAA